MTMIILRKGKQNLNETLSETNVPLKNFCLQKTFGFIGNKNINESYLQLWAKYLRQTLVFVENSALREKFNFFFSGVSC